MRLTFMLCVVFTNLDRSTHAVLTVQRSCRVCYSVILELAYVISRIDNKSRATPENSWHSKWDVIGWYSNWKEWNSGKTEWATALSEIEYTQTLHNSRRGKAEEVTAVRAHLQDEWPATDEDSDAGNDGGRSTSWTTCKKMVWRRHRLQCVCSLPEAVQLASDREE